MQPTSLRIPALLFALAYACSGSSPRTNPPPQELPTPSAAPANADAAAAPAPSKAGPAGAMCGGIAGFGCAAGLYCAFPLSAHCGAADQAGVCKPIPEMCTEQYAPVCGCNDKTYGNECQAAREGVSVGSASECASAAPPKP